MALGSHPAVCGSSSRVVPHMRAVMIRRKATRLWFERQRRLRRGKLPRTFTTSIRILPDEERPVPEEKAPEEKIPEEKVPDGEGTAVKEAPVAQGRLRAYANLDVVKLFHSMFLTGASSSPEDSDNDPAPDSPPTTVLVPILDPGEDGPAEEDDGAGDPDPGEDDRAAKDDGTRDPDPASGSGPSFLPGSPSTLEPWLPRRRDAPRWIGAGSFDAE